MRACGHCRQLTTSYTILYKDIEFNVCVCVSVKNPRDLLHPLRQWQKNHQHHHHHHYTYLMYADMHESAPGKGTIKKWLWTWLIMLLLQASAYPNKEWQQQYFRLSLPFSQVNPQGIEQHRSIGNGNTTTHGSRCHFFTFVAKSLIWMSLSFKMRWAGMSKEKGNWEPKKCICKCVCTYIYDSNIFVDHGKGNEYTCTYF